MAASLTVEWETGTSAGWQHPHNGYYAGDFPGQEPLEASIGAT